MKSFCKFEHYNVNCRNATKISYDFIAYTVRDARYGLSDFREW